MRTGTEPIFTRNFVFGSLSSFMLRSCFYLTVVICAAYCMERFGVPSGLAGIATGIFTFGCLAARFISGPLTNRFGLRRTTVVSMAVMTLSTVGYLVATSFPAFTALRLVHGLAYGVSSTTITSLTAAPLPRSRRGEGLGYFMLSVTLAAAVGPVIGMNLLQGSEYTPLFALVIAIAALTLVFMLCMRPENASELAEAREVGHAFEDADPAIGQKPSTWLSEVVEERAVPYGVVAFLAYLVYGFVMSYLDPFVQAEHLMFGGSLYFLFYAVAMLVSRPFTGRHLDAKGPALLMFGGFAALTVSIALLGLARTNLAVLVSAALMGLAMGSIQPTCLTLATGAAHPTRFTTASATFYMFTDFSCGISPVVFGAVLPFTGYRTLFELLAVVALAGLGSYVALSRATARDAA